MESIRKNRFAIVGALSIGAMLWLYLSSQSFQNCIQAPSNADAKNTFYENVSHLLVAGGVIRGCTEYFIDKAGNAIMALSTVLIALFTWTLWRTSARQGEVAQQSIDMAREEFLAANPPHLVVRNVHCRDADPGDPIKISFEVINRGKSSAYVVASAFRTDLVNEIDTFHNLPLVALGEPPANGLGDVVLVPGSVLRKAFGQPGTWTPDHFHDHGCPKAGFFFGGKILYRDAKGNERRLGFMRRLALPSRRFRPVNDSEFEYDD